MSSAAQEAISFWVFGVLLNMVGNVLINLGQNLVKIGYDRQPVAEVSLEKVEAGEVSVETKATVVPTSTSVAEKSEKKESGIFDSGILDIDLSISYVVDNDDENSVHDSMTNTVLRRHAKQTRKTGTILFIVANIMNFVSFGFAPQSLLSSLGSLQFVSNVFFSKFLHGQKVTKHVIVSTCVIIVGVVMVMTTADRSSQSYDSEELIALYEQTPYISYLVTGTLISLICEGIYLKMERDASERMEDSDDIVDHWSQPILFAVVSGFFGTQGLIFSKSMSVLLRLTFQGENQFAKWFIYFILPCFIACTVFWLKRLGFALRHFKDNSIIPIMQVVWILLSVIAGGLYFREFENLSSVQAVFFSLGLITVIAGVVMISQPKKTPSSAEQ